MLAYQKKKKVQDKCELSRVKISEGNTDLSDLYLFIYLTSSFLEGGYSLDIGCSLAPNRH